MDKTARPAARAFRNQRMIARAFKQHTTHAFVDVDAAMAAKYIAWAMCAAVEQRNADDGVDEYKCPDCEQLTECPYDCEQCTPEPVCPSCFDCRCPDDDDAYNAMVDDELVWGDE